MREASGVAVAEPLCLPSEFLHRATPLFSDALPNHEPRFLRKFRLTVITRNGIIQVVKQSTHRQTRLNVLPPDVRRRIEKWLKEHLDETADLDDIPSVVTHDGGEPDINAFLRLRPHGLSPTASARLSASISEMVEEPFANELNRWLERKGLDAVSVYKGAGVTKQVWAKLRSVGEGRKPSKDTALALAVGFKMTPDEADTFLASAGYAFSPTSRRDAIVRFYLAHSDWDILGINTALFDFGEKPLGER